VAWAAAVDNLVPAGIRRPDRRYWIEYDEFTPMSDAITEYQKWKQQGESLRVQAKQAIEARFRDLLAEGFKLFPTHCSSGGNGQLSRSIQNRPLMTV
jgi:hypothetical protein